jgi:hypothetical protein
VKLRGAAIALGVILAVAFAVRMIVAYAMPSQCWPDEIFQSLEQAHRVVFGRGVIPWEFDEGTRSWVFPGVLAGVMKAVSVVASSPMAYLMACAALLSAIALAPVWAAFWWAQRWFGLRGAVVAAGTVALWYELVYFAPKALGEVLAGNVLVVGVFVADAIARSEAARRRDVIACALLLALATMLRIQLAPAAGVCLLYVLWRVPARLRVEAVAAAVTVALVFGLVDAITWGSAFHSFIGNVRANIVEGRSHDYGMAPWYAYFQCYAGLWGVLGLAVIALAVVGATRARLAGVTALLVFLTHLPIAHKEYRFLYPSLALVIVLAGLGAALLVDRVKQARTANLAAAGTLVAMLALSLSLANRYEDPGLVFALGPKGHTNLLWTERAGFLRASLRIADEKDVCGIVLVALHWGQTGGYTYMHQDAPLLEALSPTRFQELIPYANVAMMRPDLPAQMGPFTQLVCWNTACVYRRPGGCKPIDGTAASAVAGAF